MPRKSTDLLLLILKLLSPNIILPSVISIFCTLISTSSKSPLESPGTPPKSSESWDTTLTPKSSPDPPGTPWVISPIPSSIFISESLFSTSVFPYATPVVINILSARSVAVIFLCITCSSLNHLIYNMPCITFIKFLISTYPHFIKTGPAPKTSPIINTHKNIALHLILKYIVFAPVPYSVVLESLIAF